MNARVVAFVLGAALALILAVVMLALVPSAHADHAAATCSASGSCWYGPQAGPDGPYASGEAACNANQGVFNSARNASCGGQCGDPANTLASLIELQVAGGGASNCHWNLSNGGSTVFGTVFLHEAGPACPAAGTPTTGTGSTVSGTGSDVPQTTCIGGCGFNVVGIGIVLGSQNIWAAELGNSTGETCTVGVPTPASTPTGCAAGTCPGTVNGSPVCLPCATSPGVTAVKSSATTSSTVANTSGGSPSGGSTTTVQSSSTSSGGSVTTTTTTTVTTLNSSGVPTGTSTTTTTDEKPRDTFCIENPNALICKQSTFGGGCTAGFTCEGDAAQCAAARAVNEVNCKLAPDTTATVAGMLTAAGLGTAEADWKGGNPAASDVSGLLELNQRTLPSATCPGPYSVSTWLGEIEFSLGFVCDIAAIVGTFLWLGALLLSFRIIVGGL